MIVTYDPHKRTETLRQRNLDFEDAPNLFAGPYFQIEDDRHDYGETRWMRVAFLGGDMIVMIWTLREGARRIISMRKCNAKERKKYRARMDRSG